jgi:hypothetical protein
MRVDHGPRCALECGRDTIEYSGRTHRLVSQDGWEEIADHALEWAVAHSAASVA